MPCSFEIYESEWLIKLSMQLIFPAISALRQPGRISYPGLAN